MATPTLTDAYRLTAAQTAAALETDLERGLTSTEAGARLEATGPNQLLSEATVPRWLRFLAQFKSPLVGLLLIATIVSVAQWAYEREGGVPYEALAILAIVLVNALLGFVQEARAEAAVAALRQLSAETAEVIRDGERRRVPAADVVPGDLIVVEEGGTVPADARIVRSSALDTAEAALTGESLPVEKRADAIAEETVALGDRTNMVYGGTTVSYGRAFAVVTATGMRTEMGRISELLEKTPEEQTPLQRELDRTARWLGIAVVCIAALIVATIIVVEQVHGFTAFVDVLVLGVALAVAAVPEGLPAIATLVLSIGVQRMARRRAIVRHLAAVETLGAATVIASDKTGTLTRNEMTARIAWTASGRAFFSGTGYAPAGEVTCETSEAIEGEQRLELEQLMIAAERANNAAIKEHDGRWIVQGDPTEGALLVAARKLGLQSDLLDERFPRTTELPFSSERKLMTTMHSRTGIGDGVAFTKGAPDVVLARCTEELIGSHTRVLTEDRRAEINREIERLADDALRTIGIAFRPISEPDSTIEENLVFIGVIGIIDPPRDEVRDAIARAERAGVRTVMITGDHPRTASVVAREIGIAHDRVLTGVDFERMSDDALTASAAEVSVYARVNPEHKLRLVRALQRRGAIVAMTGDGVNDAPALKSADIGVAMGVTGTDVSRQAADIVLADDNFATIVAACEEGRAIFSNVRRVLQYLLSSNTGEILTMVFGILLGPRIGLTRVDGALVLPLLATQILWINLVTDGAPALALGVEPASQDLVLRPPRGRTERVVTGPMWLDIIVIGAATALATLAVFDASLADGFLAGAGDLRYAQTMAFTTLTLAQLFNAFNARAGEHSAFTGIFGNPWLLGAIALSVLLQALVVYVPALQRAFGTVALSAGDWLRCALAASFVLVVGEVLKLIGVRNTPTSA